MNEDHTGLIVYGAGGHGKVVVDAALLGGVRIVASFDDAPKCWELCGVPVRQPPAHGVSYWPGRKFIVAVGDNQLRAQIFERLRKLGGEAVNVLHPRACVSPHARLGTGVFCAALVVVNPGATVGDDTILNTACSVDHDCLLGSHLHLCPGVRLAGGVTVEDSVLVGTGATILPGVCIGSGCIIGAGAVVRRDVPAYSLAVGVPARVISRVPAGPKPLLP